MIGGTAYPVRYGQAVPGRDIPGDTSGGAFWYKQLCQLTLRGAIIEAPQLGPTMTQTFDEQLRVAFDALAQQLRATVDDHLSVAAQHLAASAASECQTVTAAAAAEATATAERDVAERLNEAFVRREQQIREAARAEWFEAGRQQARDEVRLIQEARDAVAQATAQDAVWVAAAQASLVATIESEHDALVRGSLDRVLRAMRELDATTSLTQTLDTLTSAARAEAERVAIFLLRGDTLRAWGHTGFEAMDGVPTFEVALASAPIVADAIRTGAPQRLAATEPGRPAFAGSASTGALVVVPLTINTQVVAVLCGEQLSASDEGEWLTTIYEVLARHASRVLESVTMLRLAERLAQTGAQAALSV